MEIVRYGIIGLGNQGASYALNIFEAGKANDAILTAVCDNNPAKIDSFKTRTKRDDLVYFSDYKEMLDSGLCDAILVETPHYQHPEMVIECLNRGINVICDKPAGVYTKQVKEMNEAAKKSNSLFALMFNQRTNCVYRKMKEIIADGGIGELQRVNWIITNWYRKQAYYDSGSWRATWSGEGGGVLINQAPHNLDLWQWICGMPSSVRAECYVSKFHDIEVEDDVTIFAEYQNGATAVFITSTGDYPGTNRLEITGSAGKLVLEGGKMTLHKLDIDEREFRGMPSDAKNEVTITEYEDEKINGHCAILENFTNAVLDGTELIAEGKDAINELELSNAAYLSAWKNEKISLPVNDSDFVEILNKKRAESALRNAKQKEVGGDGYFDRWNTNW